MRQSGVVRGAGRQNWAAATNLLVYWVLGVPLAVWLAFRLRLGVFGLWGGLVIICCLQARTRRSSSLVTEDNVCREAHSMQTWFHRVQDFLSVRAQLLGRP